MRDRLYAEELLHQSFQARRSAANREFYTFADENGAAESVIAALMRMHDRYVVDSGGRVAIDARPPKLIDALGLDRFSEGTLGELQEAKERIAELHQQVAERTAQVAALSTQLAKAEADSAQLADELREVRTERDRLRHQKDMEATVHRIVPWCRQNPDNRADVLASLLASGDI